MILAPYAKAIIGGIVAGLGATSVALGDGVIDPVEWISVALATIAGLGIVWAVPNTSNADAG